ncbi:peptidylprolyl isomerase [Candidatus Babeliales bacterium]|nr:peptidylprolyl isomerase [Candidatus Babeliales bacterium]
MIYIFRKEIKKWNKIWWFVLASLVFGGASFYFTQPPTKRDIVVATVNGNTISLQDYHQVYAGIKSSFDDLAMYWGMSADKLIQMMGMGSMETTALDRCVQAVLFDDIVDSFKITIDDGSFQEALGASVSKNFIDQTGKVNARAYQGYLDKLHMSIAEFESSKEDEFKRSVVTKFLEQASYIPQNVDREIIGQESEKKQFSVLKLGLEAFLKEVAIKGVSDKTVKTFFEEKRELYRIPEKRKARYWVLTPEQYKEKVTVDTKTIELFYEKNKSSLYRIPPKVKVRVIRFNVSSNASPDVLAGVKKNAEKLCEQVMKSPKKFVEFVKKYSEDKQTAEKGGLLDFFKRGTHDPELEKAAFLTLKENGEVSDLIRTKQGFEIVKLEDRIAATQKPLDDVRSEIVKALKDRKAIVTLRGDLEAVLYAAKTDQKIYEKFATDNKLTGVDTGWKVKAADAGSELLNVLIQKLFAKQAGLRRGGYFVHRGKHILYQLLEKQESSLPKLEKVKSEVKKDWYKQKAEKQQLEIVTAIKQQIFDKKVTLEQVAKKQDLNPITTVLVSKKENVKSLEEASGLVEKAFILTDPTQVFVHKHDSTYYLVQLLKQEAVAKEADGKQDDAGQKYKTEQKRRYLDAFIASLFRNARIETNKNTLKISANH